MQLTMDFKLKEFTYFEPEQLPAGVLLNLTNLCKVYLQPLRTAFGPIYITSGYRTAENNSAVGGAKNSYHLLGLAADIKCSDVADAIKKASYLLFLESQLMINTNLLSELIVSRNSRGSVWLHVAMRKSMSDKKHYVDFQGYF